MFNSDVFGMLGFVVEDECQMVAFELVRCSILFGCSVYVF